MSTSKNNPFVLPGLGQDGDLSGNPLLASMEMMRKAWSDLAGPGGLAQSLPMAPPMNLDDLERRINELRTVESWLRMNLSMLSSAIQGMEVQRSTITTLRSFVAGAAKGADASPLEVVLGLKPAAPAQPAASAQASAPASDDKARASTDADAANMADQVSQAAQSASQAWWSLLQQQFNQIATATASSMPDAAAMQKAATQAAAQGATAATAAPQPAARKRAPRKTAAKRAPAAPKS
ncbi:PhaM family polyhydroxyalkanoate granule multifunctional regulatory protein [Bordetella tumulicola]|uniref:PhaM family polyhydroxyalkanoate granule multifunctional regulatory protein n=1 Tax=Bordetella tumulicola TaxID=1649133 RepID=UPI0039EF3358